MPILWTSYVHLTVVVMSLHTSVATPPLDVLTQAYVDEVFRAPQNYEQDDKFDPPSESTFDLFDWKLCQLMHKREAGNLVVSPVSLKLVLAMVYEGAENQTAVELRNTLDLPEDRIESRMKYYRILESLMAKQPDLVMEVASKMYVRNDVTPLQRYKRILRHFYNADLQQLDFAQSAQAVQVMNSWVSKATHGHIESMLDQDVVSASTMVLLLNAIYFKGLWRYPFNPNNTMPGSFQVSPTLSVTVPFMNMTQHLYFKESAELDCKILRIPYRGKKYSMFIVLPNKPDGLDKLLRTVNPALLRKHMFLLDVVKVSLLLPKFNFEFSTELEDVLHDMGIRDMFSASTASFPGIVQGKSVYVSKILQKAALDVNEEGTEAYVTSGVAFEDRIGGENANFHAKHPFLFYIQDEKNATVVFVGKLVDPTNSQIPATSSTHHVAVDKEQNLPSPVENNQEVSGSKNEASSDPKQQNTREPKQ